MEEIVETTNTYVIPAHEMRRTMIPAGAVRKVISKSDKYRHGQKMEEVVYHFKRGGCMHSLTFHEPNRKK